MKLVERLNLLKLGIFFKFVNFLSFVTVFGILFAVLDSKKEENTYITL